MTKKGIKVKKVKHPCLYAKAHYASHLISLAHELLANPITGGITFRMVPKQFHKFQILNPHKPVAYHIRGALESYSEGYDRRLDWPIENYIHTVIIPCQRKSKSQASLKLAHHIMVYDHVQRCDRCPYCSDIHGLSRDCDCESCQEMQNRLTDPARRAAVEQQFIVAEEFEVEERERGIRADIFQRVGSSLRDILNILKGQEAVLQRRGIVDGQLLDRIRILSEQLEATPDESATTACFDCSKLIPVEDSWSPKDQPTIALCDPCFRIREVAGRAREADVDQEDEENE